MDLVTKVQQDLVPALKAKDTVMVDTLRTLKAALQRLSIEQQRKITETQALAVVKSEIKRRQDAIIAYKNGGRMDLADKEAAEIKVLQRYQPEPLSTAELTKRIETIVQQSTTKEFGPLMKQVMTELGGIADGKQVQTILKQLLQ